MASKMFLLALVIMVVAVSVAIIFFIGSGLQNEETDAGISQSRESVPAEEEIENEISQTEIQTETQAPETQPSVKAFVIEADDYGFYINGEDISSVNAGSGENVKITFKVKSQKVYYGGLDFRGCGQDTDGIKPGGQTTLEFAAANTCTITSYWPSSNVRKDSMQVVVG